MYVYKCEGNTAKYETPLMRAGRIQAKDRLDERARQVHIERLLVAHCLRAAGQGTTTPVSGLGCTLPTGIDSAGFHDLEA